MSLIIAVPSKGRLKEKTLSCFASAGLVIEEPADTRSYQSRIMGRDDVEIAFLSASEIARELANGSVHMGITGEDLVRESIHDADAIVAFDLKLGFGQADVVVAVPDAWIDVESMADLDDVAADYRGRYGRRLRIATKYWRLTQGWFGQHGIGAYRIVESLGATEGAPAAGSADAIVDITSTGSTIRANNLKILEDGVLLRSEANLIASNLARWDDGQTATRRELVAKLASRC